MYDLEYDEFPATNPFFPKKFKPPAFSYTLAHAITPFEENKSFLEKVELGERLCGIQEGDSFINERNFLEEEDSLWTESFIERSDEWNESPIFEGFVEPSSDQRLEDEKEEDNKTCQKSEWDELETKTEREDLCLTQDVEEDDLSSPDHPHAQDEVYYHDEEEILTSEDRDRILEMGRSMFKSLLDDDNTEVDGGKMKRRRRKLPDIPKHKKPLEGVLQASLFDELSAATPSWENKTIIDQTKLERRSSSNNPFRQDSSINQMTRDILTSLSETVESSLPPSLLLHLVNIDREEDGPLDIDSGNSTSHSPDEHSRYYKHGGEFLSPISPSLSTAVNRLELLDPTHRGLHRFVPRHHDEIEIDIGDPVYVQKEAEDLWCEGINLRTGRQGIFPEAHVVDVEYNAFDPANKDERKERYILDYLGSVRCSKPKGTQIIVQAVSRLAGVELGEGAEPPHPGRQDPTPSHQKNLEGKRTCVLEICEKGIKMVDKTVTGDIMGGDANHEYFYHLKNVTFCGFHPKDHRFFAFITKHPSPCTQQYAVHVYSSENSTRCVAEAYGRAFHRFYKTFIDTVFPTEDIYME